MKKLNLTYHCFSIIYHAMIIWQFKAIYQKLYIIISLVLCCDIHDLKQMSVYNSTKLDKNINKMIFVLVSFAIYTYKYVMFLYFSFCLKILLSSLHIIHFIMLKHQVIKIYKIYVCCSFFIMPT